jgi:hypothetical protein
MHYYFGIAVIKLATRVYKMKICASIFLLKYMHMRYSFKALVDTNLAVRADYRLE